MEVIIPEKKNIYELNQYVTNISGATVYRMLGDEFMVIIQNIESNNLVSQHCEQILEALAAPYDIEGLQLVVNFSIGVALFPTDGENRSFNR